MTEQSGWHWFAGDNEEMFSIGHNGGPALDDDPFEAVKKEIEDLFDEAKNFCDGEPIVDEAMHDAITKLYDGLHDAGKRADALRVAEKKPLDDQVKAIQDKFNPLIQPKRGKVDMGKSALGDLLAAYRARIAAEKRAEAERVAKLAAEAEAAARAAMAESAGNLEARVIAEEFVDNAKAWTKAAKSAEKAATTGLGLRTVWVAVPGTAAGDEEKRLDWAYGRAPDRFAELVQQMANEAVRANVRTIPGFVVEERKVAA